MLLNTPGQRSDGTVSAEKPAVRNQNWAPSAPVDPPAVEAYATKFDALLQEARAMGGNADLASGAARRVGLTALREAEAMRNAGVPDRHVVPYQHIEYPKDMYHWSGSVQRVSNEYEERVLTQSQTSWFAKRIDAQTEGLRRNGAASPRRER